MIRSDQILKTVAMIQDQHLDVRAVTLGLDLLDCRMESVSATAERIRAKVGRYAVRRQLQEFGQANGLEAVLQHEAIFRATNEVDQ